MGLLTLCCRAGIQKIEVTASKKVDSREALFNEACLKPFLCKRDLVFSAAGGARTLTVF